MFERKVQCPRAGNKQKCELEEHRPVPNSLLSVEGKFFFAILAKRLTVYLLANNYVDTSTQKGGIPGFSGCVEHTSAKTDQTDLTVVWIDLANVYVSIPHQLIETALRHYHILDQANQLVIIYFSDIHLRSSWGNNTTPWMSLEKGIVTGCTIFVVMFLRE